MAKIELTEALITDVVRIAKDAGAEIMNVYESDDFAVEQKTDDQDYVSPLTRADKQANDVIVRELSQLGDVPVVSEENDIRSVEGMFWLVDPLDGTKEFIKRNGQFTVNIALIDNNRPIFGVVYAPAIDTLYVGNVSTSSSYKEDSAGKQDIEAVPKADVPVIVTSKSHKDEQTAAMLDAIGPHEEKSIGSSLKLCLVAEGAASLYPRLAPTMLWDTAAADAVVTASGGRVVNTSGEQLTYELVGDLRNPYFVVEAKDNTIDWQQYLT